MPTILQFKALLYLNYAHKNQNNFNAIFVPVQLNERIQILVMPIKHLFHIIKMILTTIVSIARIYKPGYNYLRAEFYYSHQLLLNTHDRPLAHKAHNSRKLLSVCLLRFRNSQVHFSLPQTTYREHTSLDPEELASSAPI